MFTESSHVKYPNVIEGDQLEGLELNNKKFISRPATSDSRYIFHNITAQISDYYISTLSAYLLPRPTLGNSIRTVLHM